MTNTSAPENIHTRLCYGELEKREHLQEICTGGMTVLKRILKTVLYDENWIFLKQGKYKWWIMLSKAMSVWYT